MFKNIASIIHVVQEKSHLFLIWDITRFIYKIVNKSSPNSSMFVLTISLVVALIMSFEYHELSIID